MVIRNTVRGIAFWKCSTAFITETEPLLQKDANKQKTQLNQPFLVVIKVKYSCNLFFEGKPAKIGLKLNLPVQQRRQLYFPFLTFIHDNVSHFHFIF